MVLTTLKKSARPMIRFRTGDIVSFHVKTLQLRPDFHAQWRVCHGRLDDMLIVQGVNIFPSDVEAVVRKDRDLTGEIQTHCRSRSRIWIVLNRPGRTAGTVIMGSTADLAHRFSRQLKSITGVGADIEILSADSLPRATHKAKRVEDRRTGVWE